MSNTTRTHARVVPYAILAETMQAVVPPVEPESDPCDA